MFNSALVADKEDRLNDWIIDYLHQSGDNDKLAKDLIRQGKFHTGLIDYPIDELDKLLGPDKSFDYYEDPTMFEHRVNTMVESIRNGWKPAPLVASKIWSEDFELHDGAHRAEALRRCGILTYPTVFYFEDEKSLDDFFLSISAMKSSKLVH
ncbi:MAG: ParB/Srx family N-terminal domain-containing protein [Patescibacteria group bacterium]